MIAPVLRETIGAARPASRFNQRCRWRVVTGPSNASSRFSRASFNITQYHAIRRWLPCERLISMRTRVPSGTAFIASSAAAVEGTSEPSDRRKRRGSESDKFPLLRTQNAQLDAFSFQPARLCQQVDPVGIEEATMTERLNARFRSMLDQVVFRRQRHYEPV